MRLPRPGRPVLVALAAVTGLVGVAGAFAGGVLVGRGHRASPSVVDQAIAAVRAHGDDAPDTSQLDADAVRGVVGGLGDQWAAYYGVGDGLQSADALRALLDGRYSGLGLWLQPGERQGDGQSGVAVASVVSGTPAAHGGLVAGDQLLEVGGTPVAQQSVEAVTAALRGPSGTVVRLTVRTAGGTDRSLDLTRQEVPGPGVMVGRPAPGVVCIRIGTFAAGTGAQVERAVQAAEAGHATGIVLDLRGDPGGLLDEAVGAASAFLDGGQVAHVAGRTVPAATLEAATGRADTSTPLVVLVDGGTASAAEVLAGALQDRHRAVVVGSRTFGKGSVQRIVPLSDGSSFELTVATYTTPDGHRVDGVGIAPDVTVPVGAAPAVGTARAVALLQALASDTGS